MFKKIFIEESVINHHRTKFILNKFPTSLIETIDKIDNFFGAVKKPYLQKRTNLNLFIGEKKGQLLKMAPDAYGTAGDLHYYFIHSYNCIYECEYCYLQGYFHSPDLVFFINHEDILAEIEKIILNSSSNSSSNSPSSSIWFHAGEFSDSLALSHITNELSLYWEIFKKYPCAKLELRTKSSNIKEILSLGALDNIFISFSISPKKRSQTTERKTAPLNARIKAMSELSKKGFQLGIHLDPIIYDNTLLSSYEELIDQLIREVPIRSISYISIGVVRFTKDVFYQVQKNYPESDLMAMNYTKSFDEKIRYSKPFRLWILKEIENLLMQKGFNQKIIYRCME